MFLKKKNIYKKDINQIKTTTSFIVDDKLVSFASKNIFNSYSNSQGIAEYYIWNNEKVGEMIANCMKEDNEIERAYQCIEIRDYVNRLGRVGDIEGYEDPHEIKRVNFNKGILNVRY